MRIGILGIQHESNTFLPQPTTLEDFRRDALLTGAAIVDGYATAHHEVSGFLQALQEEGLTAVPLLFAWAVPSGRITDETADALVRMVLNALSDAGPLDGLLVAPHGAAVSEKYPDFDGHWLTEVRRAVGPELPIACTLDPHANVSEAMIAATTAAISYRTNPHLDQKETGVKAARLLARTLRGEVAPVQRLVQPPVAISIDRQCTDESPCRELYAEAERLAGHRRVLAVSINLGFPYADVEELGTSFVVVTDSDPELADRSGSVLFDYLIEQRASFACRLRDVDEALTEALSHPETVCLLDVGDNVGGGGPGDGTALARRIAERQISRAFVCLCDPRAVEQATAAGIGGQLTVSIGGHLDDTQGPPLETGVTVVSLHDGRFEEPQARHGGRTEYEMGPTAIVRTAGDLTIMLTSQRVCPFSLQQLTSCGLDPASFHILVAKGVNAPIAAYAEVCNRMIRVNTPGLTCAEMTQLRFEHRRRPLYPFEPL